MRYLRIDASRVRIALNAAERKRCGMTDGEDVFSPKNREAFEALFRGFLSKNDDGRHLLQVFSQKDGGVDLYLTKLEGHSAPESLVGREEKFALFVQKKRRYLFSGVENLLAARQAFFRLSRFPSDLLLCEGRYVFSVTERTLKLQSEPTLPPSYRLLEFSRPYLPHAQAFAKSYLREHAKILLCGNAAELLSAQGAGAIPN